LIAAIDSTVLLHLVDPNLPVRLSSHGDVPEKCQERLEHFIDTLAKSNGRLVVPTPVLTEMLTKAGPARDRWLNILHGKRAIRVSPFDERAAIECAELAARRLGKRIGSKQKLKFDEQIVAISMIEQAEVILSDDRDIHRLAPAEVRVLGIADLDLPPQSRQGQLPLDRDE